MKIVIFSFCLKQLKFTSDQLAGLHAIINSFFIPDQFFDRQRDVEAFYNYFIDNKGNLLENQSSKESDFDGKESPFMQYFESLNIGDHPANPVVSKGSELDRTTA